MEETRQERLDRLRREVLGINEQPAKGGLLVDGMGSMSKEVPALVEQMIEEKGGKPPFQDLKPDVVAEALEKLEERPAHLGVTQLEQEPVAPAAKPPVPVAAPVRASRYQFEEAPAISPETKAAVEAAAKAAKEKASAAGKEAIQRIQAIDLRRYKKPALIAVGVVALVACLALGYSHLSRKPAPAPLIIPPPPVAVPVRVEAPKPVQQPTPAAPVLPVVETPKPAPVVVEPVQEVEAAKPVKPAPVQMPAEEPKENKPAPVAKPKPVKAPAQTKEPKKDEGNWQKGAMDQLNQFNQGK